MILWSKTIWRFQHAYSKRSKSGLLDCALCRVKHHVKSHIHKNKKDLYNKFESVSIPMRCENDYCTYSRELVDGSDIGKVQ